ncbi:MAG: AI-2E family transporter [Bacteroidales bacterium]|jgi:predicted PurR-regulated permease PerM|nr:AI-2E family transporter [Bacteroidales bacterium]
MINVEKKERNDFFRQLLFIIALIGIGIIIWQQLGFLINAFLGAFTLYIVLRSLNFKLVEKKNWKPWLSSLLLVFSTLMVLLGLFFLVFELVIAEVPSIHREDIVEGFGNLSDTINGFIGFNLMSKDLFNQFRSVLSELASNVLNKTYNVVLNFIFMIIVLYFMLVKSRIMEKTVMKYIPFDGKNLAMITKEVKTMVYSNAIGIPVVMAAQALVAGIGYWIVGLDKVIFLAFLTGVMGLVPLIGTAAIWIPLTIFQFAVGNVWQGFVLAAYSIIFIANTDYVCRTILMKAMTNTHPLIVIFGVLLGIPLFGFWGIIFGPLVISGFFLLIKIYHIQYNQ